MVGLGAIRRPLAIFEVVSSSLNPRLSQKLRTAWRYFSKKSTLFVELIG